jgi:PBSX family phage terminase large subunit
MKINLIDCLPEGRDGKKKLLPKQQEFFNSAISSDDKFISYIGGVGSGKTLIGCLTFIAMAVQKSGDYLVCRQFMPELKLTTYKQFVDMVPPELIIEHRIADAMLRIKATDGVSNIYFRPLEEPDKFRSMNLNAFYIDECNQTSEEAFTVLQGRLRGKAWRKGILTSNPSGHDWVWRWFYDKSHITDPKISNMFKLVRAPSTENVHLPDGYIDTMLATWSDERIEREIMGGFDAFEGRIYDGFKPDVHVIQPFSIPKEWPRFIGIDHGFRNPAAWIYGAVGKDGEIYIYNEYYEKEKLIKDICFVNSKYSGTQKIQQAVIDPSVNRRNGQNGESDLDEYFRWLSKDFPLTLANNDVGVGIDRVKQYLRIQANGKPLLYIFKNCKQLVDEMTQYRYEELKSNQKGHKAEKETPLKVNDHACDALRYLVMLLPEPYKEKLDYEAKLKYNSSERSLYKDLEKLKGTGKKTSNPDFGI